MQEVPFSFKKNISLFSFLVAAFSLVIISSCSGKKDDFKGMDVSCAVLLQQKMKDAWETPGYLKAIDYFTFYTSYDRGTGKFSVGVQAFQKNYAKIGGYVNLTQGTGCVVALPNVAIGENNINLADMDILKDPTTFKDFDYLKLTPKACSGNDNFMCFDLETVSGGIETPLAVNTLPCPPCQNCKPVCVIIPKEDSTRENKSLNIDSIKGK